MRRGRYVTGLLVGLLPVLALALVVQSGHERGLRQAASPPRQQEATSAPPELRPASYAHAVAANYKMLSPRESRRLLSFARDLHACLRRHGVAVGAPRTSRTRIELSLREGAQRGAVLAEGVACGDALGGPPPGASLQLRPSEHALLLYLPKYCLLDPKVAGTRAGVNGE
jgi:hypothetical protein